MDYLIPTMLTLCFIGSSATAFLYGLKINNDRTKKLEKDINHILNNPSYYNYARNVYTSKHSLRWQNPLNGRYAQLNK